MHTGEINRLLAVENPACSQPEIVAAIIGCLRDSRWGGQLEVLQTGPPSETDNIQLIQDNLQAGDVVLPLGGDGQANNVVNAVWRAQTAGQIDVGDVRAKLCAAGKGNDGARSVHGRNTLKPKRIARSLEEPKTAMLDVIQAKTSDGFDKVALSYVAFGFTGLSAVYINQPEFRERQRQRGRFVPARALDVAEVFKAARQRQPFEYQNGSAETVRAHEILLALMPRFAAGFVRLDTDPFDRKVVSLELDDRAFPLKAFAVIGRPWLSGRANGRPLDIDGQHELTFLTDTTMQYDGEPHAVAAGTKVSISHHREAIPVLL
jgi:diacylglycerol kinase family enzyme